MWLNRGGAAPAPTFSWLLQPPPPPTLLPSLSGLNPLPLMFPSCWAGRVLGESRGRPLKGAVSPSRFPLGDNRLSEPLLVPLPQKESLRSFLRTRPGPPSKPPPRVACPVFTGSSPDRSPIPSPQGSPRTQDSCGIAPLTPSQSPVSRARVRGRCGWLGWGPCCSDRTGEDTARFLAAVSQIS